MTHPHYSRAPITEAIIDFRVGAKSASALTSLADTANALSGVLPVQNPIYQGQFAVTIAPLDKKADSSVSAQHENVGYRLANSENSRVLQLRTNGFTYSHLAPYTDWNTFVGEAKHYWEKYLFAVQPQTVTRCAVRYINKFELPGPQVELKDYFTLYAEIPKEIPPNMTGMFMQLRMPQPDIGATAIINTAIADTSTPNHIAIVLDFDLFFETTVSSSDPELWETMQKLRSRKNQLFNACITNQTKELIR